MVIVNKLPASVVAKLPMNKLQIIVSTDVCQISIAAIVQREPIPLMNAKAFRRRDKLYMQSRFISDNRKIADDRNGNK